MRSHEIDYQILGSSIQVLEIELDPGETVIAEAGALFYMDPDIQFETRMGDGSEANSGLLGRLKQVGARILTGESLFMTHFTHRGRQGKARVAFAPPYPGTVIPIDLGKTPGGELIVQKDAFMAAALGTNISVTVNRRLGSGLLGGEGFIMQRLRGDGLAFVHAGGHLIERELNGERLRVDTGCIVGFEPSIRYDITTTGSLKSMLFGGEGIFFATLEGHGRIWLQSMPIRKLVAALAPYGQASRKESGSILGGLAEAFER